MSGKGIEKVTAQCKEDLEKWKSSQTYDELQKFTAKAVTLASVYVNYTDGIQVSEKTVKRQCGRYSGRGKAVCLRTMRRGFKIGRVDYATLRSK